MYKAKGFGLATIKREGESTIFPDGEEKKTGAFEYQLSKYHLHEAYQTAKKAMN